MRKLRDRVRLRRPARAFIVPRFDVESTLEGRSFAVPLFTGIAGNELWQSVAMQQGNGVTNTPSFVLFPASGTVSLNSGPSSISLPQQAPNTGSDNSSSQNGTTITTDTGPQGGSSIEVAATLAGQMNATLTTGTGPLTVGGINTSIASRNTSGQVAPLSWLVSDSGNATTGYVTATFTMSGTGGINSSTNISTNGGASLTLITPQLRVDMNDGTGPGLEIFGPTGTELYGNNLPGNGQNSDGSLDGVFNTTPTRPDTQSTLSYGATVQVRVPVTLPFTETVQYSSNMFQGAFPTTGQSGQAVLTSPSLSWSFNLSNN